jgi:L-lactate dehydrogenase (cytochrome)
MGEAGVTKALQIIRNELDLTMGVLRAHALADVDASVILPGTAPSR